MKPIDLTNLLKDLQGKWVALSDDNRHPTVYGVGNNAKEALKDASNKGYQEGFHLLFVRPLNLFFSGHVNS